MIAQKGIRCPSVGARRSLLFETARPVLHPPRVHTRGAPAIYANEAGKSKKRKEEREFPKLIQAGVGVVGLSLSGPERVPHFLLDTAGAGVTDAQRAL
jgi:hypothetical protein